ncbi:MAG: DUF3443 family protein [Steroidobacteraceae bacterium]
MRKLIFVGLVQVLLLLGGCGGGGGSLTSGGGGGGTGGSSPTGSNVVAMAVNAGPNGSSDEDADTPFITITVCAPGSTTNCQQISDVEVDTGSYGLRIISSVLSSSVMGALTQENASNNQPLVECTEFVDGISWGPVMQADVQIGGESASNVPIQVMGDSSFENEIPSGCSSMGSEEDTVAAFGANGIIGVGPFAQDCGSGCVLSNSQYAQNPTYFACPSGGTSVSDCEATGPSLDQQVTNPVADFTSTGDDNGVIVQLASVADPDGAAMASGYLVFGIGTQSNNGLGSATVLTGNDDGDITTTYNGNMLQSSFLDTGSNAYYFDAGNTTALPDCPTSGSGSGGSGFTSTWLCPTSEQSISLTNSGQNGTTSNASIKIYNANTLFNEDNGTYTAFDDLGADTGSQTTYCNTYELTTAANGDCYFDLGLPFFFGRNVYVAIAGTNTPGGEGPYFAY